MGGDHKCPVCQATFTRPQHVARHMRSHTGDRPYKCQHCGDQFARSDLLSRHINKCHANEKPAPSQGSRRKGSASASRATTSKQACDQCVQSSLPCDGSNPCAKCIQRKCRCTYVKFHRQTAPIGPGHHPRPTIASAVSVPSARLPISYPPDEFFLGPAPSSPATAVPSMAESLYQSAAFSFPPLYPEPASTAPGADFASKYRVQAELLRGTSSNFAPTGGTAGGPVGPGMPPGGGAAGAAGGGSSSSSSSPSTALYASEARPGSSWGTAVSWGHDSPDPYHAPAHPSQGTVHDKDYVNSHGIPHGLPSGAGTTYQQATAAAAAYLRRGSVDAFAGSDGSASTTAGSSAASSNVHLPLDGLVNYHTLDSLSDHRGDYSGQHHRGFNGDEATIPKSAVSSAFGLLSLDDPNLLSGFADSGDAAPSFFPPQSHMNIPLTGLTSVSGIPADDPDATPMPLRETTTTTTTSVPTRSVSASARGEGDLQLKEFWKQYMRTPSSGPGPADAMTPPRRSRVASMPSSGRTPTIAVSLQQQQQQQQQGEGGRGESGVRTTLHEDLKSYEAAVLARKAPTNLNLVPKMRRGTVPALAPAHYHGHQHSSASPVDNTFQHRLPPPSRGGTVVAGKGVVGVVPLVNFEMYGGDVAQGHVGSRPSSSLTNRSGSSGDGGGNTSLSSSSSSLAGVFGANQHLHPSSYSPSHRQHQHQQQRHQQPSSFTVRRGSPSASSTSTTGGSSSRASSVATDHGDNHDDAEVDIRGTDEGNEDLSPDDRDNDDGRHRNSHHLPSPLSPVFGDGDEVRRRKRNVDSVGRLRPAFKRLASTTLGPVSSKRQFLVPPGGVVESREDENTREVEGGMECMGMGGAIATAGVDGFAPGALGMN